MGQQDFSFSHLVMHLLRVFCFWVVAGEEKTEDRAGGGAKEGAEGRGEEEGSAGLASGRGTIASKYLCIVGQAVFG